MYRLRSCPAVPAWSPPVAAAGRICGDRRPPKPGQWPTCGPQSPGYSAGVRQLVVRRDGGKGGPGVRLATTLFVPCALDGLPLPGAQPPYIRYSPCWVWPCAFRNSRTLLRRLMIQPAACHTL